MLLLLALVLPAAAPGAGCSPLNCAPSQLALAHGRLLAVRPGGISSPVRVLDLASGKTRWRLPAGILTGHTLVHADGTLITWFDAATGARLHDATRQVKGQFSLVGTSQDGARAVLARTQTRSTTFAIVTPENQRTVRLGGRTWQFDALGGSHLYLLRYLKNGYQVRLFDLAHDRLVAQPLKDPHESSLISGLPWQRLSSADGRYLFTLYVGSNGDTMVHELDLRNATARCIDLPGTGDFNRSASYSLLLFPDGRTLWAVSPGYGRVVAVDVASARVRAAFARTFSVQGSDGPLSSVAALSPGGNRAAIGLGGDLWVIDLATQKIVLRKPHVALALGFSPDGTKLWGVGEKSRVFSLSI